MDNVRTTVTGDCLNKTGILITKLTAFLAVFSLIFFATVPSAHAGDKEGKNDEGPSIMDSGILLASGEDGGPTLRIGGALRYNLYLEDYVTDRSVNDRRNFTFDTWRINVNGEASGIKINFEYRFYPTFGTSFIKQGWLGYDFNESTNLQVGVTQVPFGNLTYASHSWWFQNPYYVGLEDDYDMGFKLTHKKNNWSVMLAYFVQPEPNGPANFGPANTARYSYDIVPTANQPNQEVNQFNARVAYTLDHGSLGSSEIGVSGQVGGIYNSVADKTTSRSAFAAHLNGNYGNFNVKAEYIYYNFEPTNAAGDKVDLAKMAAYGVSAYDVASEANMYVIGAAYSVDVDWGPVSNINFYEDYTYTDKVNDAFVDTQQNVLGFMVTAGNVYTYFDIASGKNHPWLTESFGQGLGAGVQDPKWKTRFNINIGYYF